MEIPVDGVRREPEPGDRGRGAGHGRFLPGRCVWGWNGTSWTPLAPAIAPRTHAALAWLPEGLLLVGGMGNVSSLRLTGGQWASTGTRQPGPRHLPALAYDRHRGVAVLFGGGDPAGNRLFNDTWEYASSTGWRRIP